jgi:hypothetical protein
MQSKHMKSSRPSKPDPSTEAVERFLLVTLALEESLQGEDFAEASALFIERAAILDGLANLIVTDDAKLSIDRVQAIERRIMGFLTEWRGAALRGLGSAQTGRRAATAYLSSVCGASFSMDGHA